MKNVVVECSSAVKMKIRSTVRPAGRRWARKKFAKISKSFFKTPEKNSGSSQVLLHHKENFILLSK